MKDTTILGLAEVLDDAVDTRILTRQSAETILSEVKSADAEITSLRNELVKAADEADTRRKELETMLDRLIKTEREVDRLKELVVRAQNDMMAIESRCLTKNREKARSMEFVPILSIVSKWTATPLK